MAGLILAVCAALVLLAYRSGLLDTGFSGALAVYGDKPFSLGQGRIALCAFDGGLAVSSGEGLRFIDKSGGVRAQISVLMDDPAVAAGDDACIFWDGGTPRAWITSNEGRLIPILAEGDILFASAGPECALLLTEDESYQNTLTVYDTGGEKRFAWYSAEGAVLSARLSPDGRSLAAISFAGETWTLRVFEIRTGVETAKRTEDGNEAGYFDLAWLSKNSLCALSASGAGFFDRDLTPVGRYDFEGKALLSYRMDDFAVLALRSAEDEAVTLLSLDQSAGLLGLLETGEPPLSIDLRDGKALILGSEGLQFYGRDLKPLGKPGDTQFDKAVFVSGGVLAGSTGPWGRYLTY